MKILVVSSKFPPEYAGSGLRAHTTYRRLRERYGIEYDVVCNSVAHRGDLEYEHEGSRVRRISRVPQGHPWTGFPRKLAVLAQLIREFQLSHRFIRGRAHEYQLVHTFGNSWSVAFFTLYFAARGKPVIRELCNDMDDPLYPAQFRPWIRRIFQRNNTAMVAISKRLEELASGRRIQRVWQRPNPVDAARFRVQLEERERLRRRLTPFDSDDVVLTYVATYRPSKNHIFLLDVLEHLPARFKLLLAGPVKEGHEGVCAAVEAAIADRKLEHRVELRKGFVEDVHEYMQLANVFAFPSTTEGLGTPVLEAQACGIPVVANLIKGVTDVEIEQGAGGYTTPLEPAQFALNVRRAAKIPRETLMHNAHQVLARASSDVIDASYYDLLQNLLGET